MPENRILIPTVLCWNNVDLFPGEEVHARKVSIVPDQWYFARHGKVLQATDDPVIVKIWIIFLVEHNVKDSTFSDPHQKTIGMITQNAG